jgi:hypothetical protein
VLCRKFGWDPAKVIKLHKEDPKTDHNCPGKNVSKADVIARVAAEMTRLAGAKPPIVPPATGDWEVGVGTAPPTLAPAVKTLRTRMAQAIVDFEARRDKQGRLTVYKLPANDGGGDYEVAGINQKYDGPAAYKLKTMIEAGRQADAEAYATDYIAKNTDFAATMTRIPCLESYLRDCIFNRGKAGATMILQIALGFAGSHASPRYQRRLGS